MKITAANSIQTNVLVSRLSQYITLTDICNYIGISVSYLAKLPTISSSSEYTQEHERDPIYHLRKIKHFMETGVEKPIDLDNISINGRVLALPVIIDGRHRYLAALLRRDKTVPVTYSGRQDLLNYLTGASNDRPRND